VLVFVFRKVPPIGFRFVAKICRKGLIDYFIKLLVLIPTSIKAKVLLLELREEKGNLICCGLQKYQTIARVLIVWNCVVLTAQIVLAITW